METGQLIAGWVVLGTCLPIAGMLWLSHRHSHTPGSRGLTITLAGFVLWNAVSGAMILRPTGTVFWAVWGVHLFAANLAAIGWAIMALEYTRRRRLEIGYRGWALFFAIPIATQLLYATNAYHHLVVQPPLSIADSGALDVDHGGWFYVHATYNYVVLTLGGTLLLLGDAVKSSGIHRRQTLLLFGGMAVAIAASVGFLLELPVPGYVDPAPFGFLVTASLWTYAVFRHRLFNLVPVARRSAVETIPDAMVVVDVNGLVVDFNAAAKDLFDVSGRALGTPATELFDEYPSLLERFDRDDSVDTEISVVDDGQVRHFSLTMTPASFGGSDIGTIVMLRDVTSLKNRQQEFALLQRLFSRVLRHNLRNDLQVIRGYAEQLREADPADEETRRYAEAIIERADDLDRTSQKARRIEGVIGSERDRSVHDLGEIVDDVIACLEAAHPDVSVDRAGPEEAWVRAHPELRSAVRNLLENAVVHANTDDPRVNVSVTESDDEVTLEIEDDGPGIPPAELAALRARSETALEHGSGAGLWLTDWVTTKSDGELAFEVTDEGTVAAITLSKATAISG